MTKIYFVRHAQPVHSWQDDRTRPLTDAGSSDSKKVTALLKTIEVDCFYSSPYKRSVDTIYESSVLHGLDIAVDERLRECAYGASIGSDFYGIIQHRWSDFDYCEDGGESLGVVQKRNIEAILEMLESHNGQSIVVGTHGTALSTILNYFNPLFGSTDYFRIANFTPYVIRLDFSANECVGQEEILIVEKVFEG